MNSRKKWINLSITNLCIVAALGVLMRSKIIFNLPWIDYNRLVDTHGHFAFAGWVTLILTTLLVYELPGALYNKKVYQILLELIFASSWATLFTSPFASCKFISEYISVGYIIITYIFSWVYINNILKTTANKTVKLISVASLICLILSSAGVLMLAYLFAKKSLNAILYRDALFGYLHLQYNGFFTLAVFALIFNKIVPMASQRANKNIYRFAVLLCLSVIPSMFTSFLWHQATPAIHIVSVLGSLFLLLSLLWFIISISLLSKEFKMVISEIRYMVILSLSAFIIKIFLQSLTVFNSINVLVFGNRPMIMGFLHMVFLGFVTLFIIAYFTQKGILNGKSYFTRFALAVFTLAVVINEILLMLQGLGTWLVTSSPLFSWYLWGAGLLLLLGAILIAIARIKTKQGLSASL
ncbi:MAG TPA: hypothetical protein VNY36_09285 [Bacteroidia bacterium]|jgi:hypothetical protein|nr:hypothetical protein [Bacteroidia bacterium]